MMKSPDCNCFNSAPHPDDIIPGENRGFGLAAAVSMKIVDDFISHCQHHGICHKAMHFNLIMAFSQTLRSVASVEVKGDMSQVDKRFDEMVSTIAADLTAMRDKMLETDKTCEAFAEREAAGGLQS